MLLAFSWVASSYCCWCLPLLLLLLLLFLSVCIYFIVCCCFFFSSLARIWFCVCLLHFTCLFEATRMPFVSVRKYACLYIVQGTLATLVLHINVFFLVFTWYFCCCFCHVVSKSLVFLLFMYVYISLSHRVYCVFLYHFVFCSWLSRCKCIYYMDMDVCVWAVNNGAHKLSMQYVLYGCRTTRYICVVQM